MLETRIKLVCLARNDNGVPVQILDSILFYCIIITVTQVAPRGKRLCCIGSQGPLGVAGLWSSDPVCVFCSSGAAAEKQN